jgi:T5SS/PEP-CTERM-associated repeat protein
VSAGGAVEIGANYLGNGTVTVSGSGSILTDNSSLTIGYGSAQGLLSIASYGLVSATATTVSTECTLEFGQNATLNSPLTVTGGTLEGSGSGSMLTIGANVTLGANSTLAIDIDASSNAADSLNITNGGSLILTGHDTLTVDLINGTQLTAEDYVIAMVTGGGTIEGEFAVLNIPPGYTMDYGGGVPGEVRLVAEVVPEPGSWGMVVGGIGAVGMAGRFRRRKAGGP